MLSREQQDIIENSIWVVNTALKRQNQSRNEDLRQSAILYMCECLLRFDDKIGIKWTTYAYKNVLLYVKRAKMRENRRIQRECDDEEYITQCEPIAERQDDNEYLLSEIAKVCTPNEKRILELKLQGYKHEEIRAELSCSLSTINKYVRRIKDKATGLER